MTYPSPISLLEQEVNSYKNGKEFYDSEVTANTIYLKITPESAKMSNKHTIEDPDRVRQISTNADRG